MSKRKHRFVVGYQGDRECVYGADHFKSTAPHGNYELGRHVDLMTEWQAARALREMPCDGAVIYELVPVKERDDE